MTFWLDHNENPIWITTSEENLPNVEDTKILGVTIDNKMTWTKHINNIIAKLSVNKNLIGRSKNLMNQSA